MPLYEVTSDQLKKIEETSFREAGIRERADLQRLLRSQIEIVAPDTMVIAEEFSEWEDNSRRIDLLAIDKEAKLVVIELKRTDDGGHMELQALRYAAMVSALTWEDTVKIYANYLNSIQNSKDAHQELLDFLELDEPDQENFAQDVRIVLASAEFSKEITTSVMWLNTYGLDIRCVRLKPYNDNGRIILDIEQVIPLPEAIEYQVQVNVKTRQGRVSRVSGRAWVRYDVTINGHIETIVGKRNAIFHIIRYLCEKGVKPEQIAELIYWRSNRLFTTLDGTLTSEDFISAASQQDEAQGKRFEYRRWFCDDVELIHKDNKTYAFSNQWGGQWDEAMKILMDAFPEEKIAYKVNDTE